MNSCYGFIAQHTPQPASILRLLVGSPGLVFVFACFKNRDEVSAVKFSVEISVAVPGVFKLSDPDGSDPLGPDGNPSVTLNKATFGEPIRLDRNVRVISRSFDASDRGPESAIVLTNWNAPRQMDFTISAALDSLFAADNYSSRVANDWFRLGARGHRQVAPGPVTSGEAKAKLLLMAITRTDCSVRNVEPATIDGVD